jgi:hypothetical protein
MAKKEQHQKIRIQVNSELSKEFAADGMRKGPGCKNGIRHWDVTEPPQLTMEENRHQYRRLEREREQPWLEGMRKCSEILWKTF